MPPSEPSPGSPLLSEAKLAPPRRRPGLIARPRLFAMLDRFEGAELTLISAPAGSGKTVMVSSWLEQRSDLSVAWVTVERRDDDSVRLWTAVCTAVDRVRPGIARPALVVLRTPRSEIETAIDELLNGLAGYAGRVVVVLDDLHHVTDQDFLRSLGYALERLPQTTRLVATTRSDPSIKLGRFRARGALGEVRAADLALTVDEARELMAAHGVGRLEPEDVERLVERTEGWTAGVGLAGMWLSGNDAPREHLRQFSASHTHVADYLTTEVLDILAADVRSFLLRTSVLSRFTSKLCDQVLETTDAAETLAAIARSNLFLVPLDGRGEWYRYHHLFRELLLTELGATDANAAPHLHLRASAWFAEEGMIEDALEHAAASGDPGALAKILEDESRELIRTGRSDTLLQWLERLPPEEIAKRPLLAAIGALTSGLLAQPAAVRRRYAAVAEAGCDALPEPQRLYVEAVVALTRGGVLDRDLDASLADARRAADLAVRHAPDLALPTLAVLGYTEYLAGNDGLATAATNAAFDRPEVSGRPSGVVYAHAVHGLLALDRGRQQAAQDAAVESVALAEELGLAGTWSAGIAHHAFGEVLLAQGRPGEAERELERAFTLRQASEPRLDALHSLIQLARARVTGGRLTLAESDLAGAREQLTAFTDAGRLRGMMAEVEAALEAARTETPHVYEPPSAAELSILQLLESDLSQREMGEELFLSVNTVKTHSRRLYAKLGAHSRAEAIQKGHALGLIDRPPASPSE
jgi:LuxR family maltose regulon positive regulatory protein